MTPIQFADLYRTLKVFMLPFGTEGSSADDIVGKGAWKTVPVKSYRLGASSYRESFFNDVKAHIGKEGVKVLVKTIGGTEGSKLLLTNGQVWQHFRHPFAGKGTPEQVQLAIQLLYRFHKVSAAFADPTKFAAQSFLGLDCNGFIGNYIQRGRGGDADWTTPGNYSDPGPNTMIAELLRLPGNEVLSSMDQLAASPRDIYILAYCSSGGVVYDHGSGGAVGHIMITEPNTIKASGKELTVQVAESTGGVGLVDTQYRIMSVRPAQDRPKEGVFRVFRGSHNHEMDVKISRLC